MYLYIIFGFISLLAFSELNLGRKFGKIAVIPIVFIFFLLSFLRWERGTDWSAYKSIFENIATNEYLQMMYEFLFMKLNIIIHSISGDYTLMLFCQACIIYFCYLIILRKYSASPILSVAVWLSLSLGSIFFTRQAIAISICLLSFHFIFKRKVYYFLLTVFLAMLFHQTAFIFLPAYWIYKLNLSRKQMILILIGSFVLTFAAQSLLSLVASSSLGSISERGTAYTESGSEENFGSAYSPMETMVRGLVYRIGLIAILMTYFYDLYRKDQFFRGFYNLFFVSIILFILFVPISVALIRFAGYYEIFQIFLFPVLLLYTKDNIYRNCILLLILLYLGFKFNGVITGYEDLYIPYKSIFNKELQVEIW